MSTLAIYDMDCMYMYIVKNQKRIRKTLAAVRFMDSAKNEVKNQERIRHFTQYTSYTDLIDGSKYSHGYVGIIQDDRSTERFFDEACESGEALALR